jgi:hypothetical protein
MKDEEITGETPGYRFEDTPLHRAMIGGNQKKRNWKPIKINTDMEVKIGIDNGVSGSVAVITEKEVTYAPVPVFLERNYTKKKSNVNRIDVDKLKEMLSPYVQYKPSVNVERPMVNPGRFKASVSAIRALEATSIALEQLGLEYSFVDSKGWQKEFLPTGVKGAEALKASSRLKGIQLYPHLEKEIIKQKDADGLFIAMI